MKIKSVSANWLHVPIPYERQHVSDFGRIASFDSVLVTIETECGLVGYGEAKEEVGSEGNSHALVAAIERKLGPSLIGEDPRDIVRIEEQLSDHLTAQVEIRVKKRTRRGEQGEIAIAFGSLEELNGLLDKLGLAER